MRILLAEDFELTLTLLARVLRRAGHDVAPAATAAEAERLCGAEAFDVLLLNLNYPDGDGWSLLERLRAGGCLTPAIAVTCLADAEAVERSRRAGFAAHMPKPILIDELLKCIADVTATSPAKHVSP